MATVLAKSLPTITDAERQRRQDDIDFARTCVALEGFKNTPEVEALEARYVAGELTSYELDTAIFAKFGMTFKPNT